MIRLVRSLSTLFLLVNLVKSEKVEIIEQVDIEKNQIDTFEWRQAYRRRWSRPNIAQRSISQEQLDQTKNDDNLLNSLSVKKQQFSFRKIPVESPISLLLELNNAVESQINVDRDAHCRKTEKKRNIAIKLVFCDFTVNYLSEEKNNDTIVFLVKKYPRYTSLQIY